MKSNPPGYLKAVAFEVTFQVVTESSLDELAAAQEIGLIPAKYLKEESSYESTCD